MKVSNDFVLTCQQQFQPERLIVTYKITNKSPADAYVLDTYPAVDQEKKKAIPDPDGVCVFAGEGAVHMLRGIPPLPADRTVTVRLIPLGTKLAAGATLERKFTVPLPLVEQSPYYSPLNLRDYQETKVERIVLSVQVLRSSVAGFAAEAAPHGPDLFRVRSDHTVTDVETAQVQVKVPEARLLKRKDNFPRL